MTHRRIAQTTAAFALVVSLTSCAHHGGAAMHPTQNQQQTSDLLQQHLQQSVAALTPHHPSLRPVGTGQTPCDDPNDAGDTGKISLYAAYLLDNLPKGPDAAPLFDQILTYWTTHGFRLRSDERPTTQSIDVENTTDGVRIGIETGRDGTISLSLSSACIWPNGTPEQQ
jgi:hypothetical protein